MADEGRSTEVQKTDGYEKEDETEILPVPPLPVAGFTPVVGQISAAAGGLNPAGSTGMAPLIGGATTFGATRDPGAYEDGDMLIADRVEEALGGDGRITSTQISVAVGEGTVELTGTVPTERERASAEEVCLHVPGVRSVVNKLSVPAA